jgi:hypothetical protein
MKVSRLFLFSTIDERTPTLASPPSKGGRGDQDILHSYITNSVRHEWYQANRFLTL